MTTEAIIASPNSLLLVMEPEHGIIPESMNGQLVSVTPSCIAVGTLSSADGKTRIVLSDELPRPHEESGLRLVFAGSLQTPKRLLNVCTVDLVSLLSLEVKNVQTDIEHWANDEAEPSEIHVFVK